MSDVTKWLDWLSEKRSPRAWLLLGAAGAILFLPLLGHYGLWDPHEVRIADIAREMAHTKSWAVPQRFGFKPPLLLAAIAAGYRFLGNSEIAGRLPVALLSIAALLSSFYAGTALLRRRAALLGSLALLMTPVFFLGARQLTSAVAPILATTLAVGGLARAAWPRRDEAPMAHLLIGLAGLVLGQTATGFGLGVAVPLIAIAAAVWAAGPLSASGALAGAGGEAIAGGAGDAHDTNDDQPPPSGLTLPRVAFGGLALGAIALTLWGWLRTLPSGAHPGYSWIVGGTPHLANHQIQATSLLKQIGFSAFPWIVIAPLAAARLFAPRDGKEGAGDEGFGRDGFGRFVLVAWTIAAYVATTLYTASVGETTFGAFAAIALLAGAFLDDALEAGAPWVPQSVAALVVLVGAAVIAHDYFMSPENYAGAHVAEGIKWPPPLTIPAYVLLAIGMVWGALVAAALVVPPAPPRWLPARDALLGSALAASFVLTGITVYWMVPAISAHLSYKGLFVKYKSIVGTGASEIGKFHVPGQLSDYGKTTELASLPQMFDFLGKPERVFVIPSADDLPGIDQYAKQRAKEQAGQGKAPAYYVIDDSNSKFLMLSNQLGAEKDLNPLRRFVLPVEGGLGRTPEHEVHADFEGKVELIGYDLPAELERGKPFKMTTYYKVNQPVSGAFRVFLHFDGPGTRFNGDHTPLDGKFPTNYWVPGFYVIDEYTITPDRVTQPAGNYTIYSGFWLGDQRLKVVAGPSDGENRVKVGLVRVK